MQLIGMLDSPYVRRVAISLRLLGLPFEQRPISVFSTFEQFRAINPVVKAPSLVCDDGTVLMDSSLILDYAEALAAPRRSSPPRPTGEFHRAQHEGMPASLMPVDLAARRHALRVIGLALAACEKSVQIVYERNLRPADKLHRPWLERVTSQLLAAFGALEAELIAQPLPATSETIDQAGVSSAVAWYFSRQLVPDVVAAAAFPALQAHSDRAETLAEFIASPHE